jgi:hypothetical protein
VLKDDGTWSFVESPKGETANDATLAYEGKRKTFAIHLKPGTWVMAEAPDNPDAEVEFTHKEDDLYAMVIAERIAVQLDMLKKAALKNMQLTDKDAKIVHEEMRKVGGVDVLCVTSHITVEGIPLTYHSYYHTGQAGSIQVITWTGRNIFEESKSDMEELLNGLVILKK